MLLSLFVWSNYNFFKSVTLSESDSLRLRLKKKQVQDVYCRLGVIVCTFFIFYNFYLEILDFILHYKLIILSLILIWIYPLIHNKMFKINYIIISKFVKSSLPYRDTNHGGYVQLISFCLFALIMLYLKSLLYYYNSDFILTLTKIFNIIPWIILSLIFSADTPNLISVLIFNFKRVIIIKLGEIYTNIKLDPCYFIADKITILLSIKYALVIVILLFSFSWYESILSYFTFDYLFKFITSLKNIISDMSYNNIISNRSYNKPLYIVPQSEQFKDYILQELNIETGLSKPYLMTRIGLSPNDFEFMAGLMKIDRIPEGHFAVAWNTEKDNSFVKLVSPNKLMHTKPLEGNDRSGIFKLVGHKRDLNNIIRSTTCWSVYMYSISNNGNQNVYQLVDSIWHPKCKEGLFNIAEDPATSPRVGRDIRMEPYRSGYPGDGNKHLYFYDHANHYYHSLTIHSPIVSDIGTPLCKSKNLALTVCVPSDSMRSTKIGLDNKTFFKSVKPVIIEE